MEIPPYISSGAISRSHYSLIRNVEYTSSVQSANQSLSEEVETIQRQFAESPVSLDECRKHLVTLLYCHQNVSHGFLPPDAFYFALSHAVTLAEAGRTTSQKRIGYLFCAEVMPANHELQLMLVNTLRKDLEHEDIPRICLALENIITSSNEDLVPAVQPRLYELLSHNSPHVRRRALFAYRSFANRDMELLSNIEKKVITRCNDSDSQVASAALALYVRMKQAGMPLIKGQGLVNDLLTTTLNGTASHSSSLVARILSALHVMGLSEDNISVILELIRSSVKDLDRVVLRGAFKLLMDVTPAQLLSVDTKSPVHYIRSLLTSNDPNDVYLFLTCLECVDPVLWAGTSSEVPAVLDGWEVERIMQLLDLSDSLVRRTTLKLLSRVDMGIVSSHYAQVLRGIPSGLSIKDLNNYGLRAIGIINVQSGEDGEHYAQELKGLLIRLEKASLEGQIVLEAIVDTILTDVRHAGFDFAIGFSTVILASLTELEQTQSQTMLVIIAALAVEQCGKLSIRPLDILEGFASNLRICIPPVKDACLLAMLRVAAECDEVPSTVVDTVTELGQHSKRHLRQRCEQFTALVTHRTQLTEIVKKARSSSLPDFLAALTAANDLTEDSSPSPSKLAASQSLSKSKLRYDAYDTPIPGPKLRDRDISRSPRPTGQNLSDVGPASLTRVSSRLSESSADVLSRTLTPGELTLAASQRVLEPPVKAGLLHRQPTDDLVSRVDLISLDSPFVSEPSEVSKADMEGEADFDRLWNSIDGGDMRGWFNGSVGVAVERIQGLEHTRLEMIPVEQLPYPGDLKLIVWFATGEAAVRLKESEEDSCLWRLRCKEGYLRDKIKERLG